SDALRFRGRQVDIVHAEAGAGNHLAARERVDDRGGDLRVADHQPLGIPRYIDYVGLAAALRKADLSVDALERGLDRSERGERAIGDGNDGAGHREFILYRWSAW